MIRQIAIYSSIFVSGEFIAILVFSAIRKFVAAKAAVKKPDIETFKGALERLVIFAGLASGHSTVLVMFGTLKLGTRLHDEGNKDVSNNYFLIGNLLSVLIAVGDTMVLKNL